VVGLVVQGHAGPVCRHIVLCYFAIFIHVPILNASNELGILSETGVIATTEASVVLFVGFHPTKNI